MLMFPGTEEHFGEAYEVMTEAGLKVKHLVWDKGYAGGNVGARLTYSTEDVLLGYTQPEVNVFPTAPAGPNRPCCGISDLPTDSSSSDVLTLLRYL